jgi:Cft2 family RNA processing exonuclease
MKLIDLNREGGIGSSCTLLQIGELNILIDSGLHPKLSGRAAMPDFARLQGVSVDLIILTHCHLDHLGTLPVAMREHPNAPVLMSLSSRMIVERMLHNSANVMKRQLSEGQTTDVPHFTHEDIDRCAPRMSGLAYGHPKKFSSGRDEIEVTLHAAGHVAGACAVELRHKHRHIFITGDVLFEDQRVLKGARFPAGHFDTLITETTRGTTERPEGKERLNEVARLINTINSTIQAGGSVLIPVFALGRMQELLAIFHDARKFGKLVNCPIFTSGLGLDLCDYFDEISRKTKHVQFSRSILKELHTQPLPRKLEPGVDPKQKAIYLISSGMLVERTPSYTLASGLLGHAHNTIAFVGYCDPSTPGGVLQTCKHGDPFLFTAVNVKTTVKAKVERFELSGHADREELLQFAVQTDARCIVLAHGEPEARKWFQENLAARMPNTKVIDPVPGQVYEV